MNWIYSFLCIVGVCFVHVCCLCFVFDWVLSVAFAEIKVDYLPMSTLLSVRCSHG